MRGEHPGKELSHETNAEDDRADSRSPEHGCRAGCRKQGEEDTPLRVHHASVPGAGGVGLVAQHEQTEAVGERPVEGVRGGVAGDLLIGPVGGTEDRGEEREDGVATVHGVAREPRDEHGDAGNRAERGGAQPLAAGRRGDEHQPDDGRGEEEGGGLDPARRADECAREQPAARRAQPAVDSGDHGRRGEGDDAHLVVGKRAGHDGPGRGEDDRAGESRARRAGRAWQVRAVVRRHPAVGRG
ncbi:MAG: hypothetical protein DYG93_07195 [Leptolyngbya sp. PLA2]|nr:hypothetical protein [Leptolyngbya sp. PL-A2]MCQ3940649.1 hypothetical protein [cyanobacterium CYA1]